LISDWEVRNLTNENLGVSPLEPKEVLSPSPSRLAATLNLWRGKSVHAHNDIEAGLKNNHSQSMI